MQTTLGAAAAGTAGATDRLAAAHAQVLHDPAIQFRFEGIKPPPDPTWLKWLAPLIKAMTPFFQVIFWGGLALVAGTILFFVAREVVRSRWKRDRKALDLNGVEEWRPTAAAAAALLEEADRLAGQGEFEAAAHVLLYRSIQDIQSRRPHLIRPALTSRDIAQLEDLPAAARPAFSQIAEVVERSYFGGLPVSRADFARCRDAYEAFAFPEAWR